MRGPASLKRHLLCCHDVSHRDLLFWGAIFIASPDMSLATDSGCSDDDEYVAMLWHTDSEVVC